MMTDKRKNKIFGKLGLRNFRKNKIPIFGKLRLTSSKCALRHNNRYVRWCVIPAVDGGSGSESACDGDRKAPLPEKAKRRRGCRGLCGARRVRRAQERSLRDAKKSTGGKGREKGRKPSTSSRAGTKKKFRLGQCCFNELCPGNTLMGAPCVGASVRALPQCLPVVPGRSSVSRTCFVCKETYPHSSVRPGWVCLKCRRKAKG